MKGGSQGATRDEKLPIMSSRNETIKVAMVESLMTKYIFHQLKFIMSLR